MLLFLAAASVIPAISPACHEIHPPEISAREQTYALAQGVRLVFGRDVSLDTASDYGQRAMLYAFEHGVLQRRYYSSGSQDSSAMTPTFFGHCGPYELLVLADVGNEFSWGFRIFGYDGRKLRDLGEVPIAVKGDPDMESAIPFVKLAPLDRVIVLTFTTDVIKDPGTQFPQPLAAKDVRYQIGLTSIREE